MYNREVFGAIGDGKAEYITDRQDMQVTAGCYNILF
jgi:hypothetical protein